MATSISTTSISGLGLSGLSSGLDTSGIITKLMAIESAPQSQLKTQLTTLQTHTTALQSLNTAVAAVATTAKAALGANALTSFTATSSSSAATVSASSAASAGSLSFTVDRLAAAQVTVTDAMTTWDTTATPSITVRTGAAGATQTDTTLTFTSSNLDDVVAAINGGKLGVTATKVAAGTDANGAAQFRLQLRSAPGASNAFAVSHRHRLLERQHHRHDRLDRRGRAAHPLRRHVRRAEGDVVEQHLHEPADRRDRDGRRRLHGPRHHRRRDRRDRGGHLGEGADQRPRRPVLRHRILHGRHDEVGHERIGQHRDERWRSSPGTASSGRRRTRCSPPCPVLWAGGRRRRSGST